jgi:hypothetical protein
MEQGNTQEGMTKGKCRRNAEIRMTKMLGMGGAGHSFVILIS